MILTTKKRRAAVKILDTLLLSLKKGGGYCGQGKPGDPGFDPNNTCQHGGSAAKPSGGGRGASDKPKPPGSNNSAKPNQSSSSAVQKPAKPKETAGAGRFDIQTHSKQVEKNLDAATISTFRDYSGQFYRPINSSLRKGESLNGNYNLIAAKISDTIQKHGKLPSPVQAYRGMHFDDPKAATKFIKQLKPGGDLQLKGFTSTSTDPKIAGVFSGGKSNVQFEITVKKGIMLGSKKMSAYPNEKELLLDHNSKFKVKEVKTSGGGGHVVYLEQME